MSHQPKIYFTRKRHRDEEMERELMRQNAEFQTKIIDVNDDCLEKIFMYLDIDDFINIAHTNTQLKPAADMAFARKFAKKRVKLEIKSKYRKYSTVEISDNQITIYDFQTSLRLLRCFGHLVSKLDAGPKYTSQFQWTGVRIVGYANEFCANSLVVISFRNMLVGAFEELKQPFSKVTIACFRDCTLDGKLKQLSKWFPIIHHLFLHQVETQINHIEANSPYLLSIFLIERRHNYSAEHVMNTLRSNPLLHVLFLDVDGWMRILQNASENLLWLQHIHILCYPKDFSRVENHVCNFRHHLRIDFRGFRFQPLPRIPISFVGLQTFTWGSNNHRLDQSIIKFFEEHRSITKLSLRLFSESVQPNSEDIMHIARALPLLQEVNFERIELSVDQVIAFLDHTHLLKRMCFYMTDRTGFDRLKILLGKKWQASIDGQRVELEYKDKTS